MKTKLILHGGFTHGIEHVNDAFFKEMLNGTPEEVKVLLVYFAKEADRISENKREDIEQFNKNKGSKTLVFKVATEKDFEEQVKWADVLYLHGGKSTLIVEAMKKFPNAGQMLEGKIIGGDSAGANILSAVFYSKMADKVLTGLGILPIKLICHYIDDYKGKLDSHRPDLETLHLPEYEYKTFEL